MRHFTYLVLRQSLDHILMLDITDLLFALRVGECLRYWVIFNFFSFYALGSDFIVGIRLVLKVFLGLIVAL